MIVCCVIGCGDDNDWPVTNDHPSGEVIVAFGDSLTFGQGATRGETYPDHLSHMIGRPVINEGVNGNTTAHALRRIESILAQKPAVVIITLGGNDVMRKVPVEQTVDNLRAIVRKLQEIGAMVVYAAVNPPLWSNNWNEALQQMCRDEGVLYIDGIMKGLWTDRKKMSDQIHPNGQGYKVLAERIHARLEPHLR